MKSERKAAVAEYKKRKAVTGIYAVHCAATGQRWVGQAPDLETIRNRLWFALRAGAARPLAMQAAWHEHGPESFRLEVLERLDEEELAYVRDRKLKDRLAHWRGVLSAELV